MIANMIQNSIQVCEDQPEIEVWAGAINQHMMLIRVSDNGPGIPNDVIDQVLIPSSPLVLRELALVWQS